MTFKQRILNNDFLLMPGAMGTELQRRGYDTKLPLWSAGANLDAPDLVEQIHYDYLVLGADICVTNTFRTTPRTYAKLGTPELARDAMKAAVGAAKNAAARITDRPVYVAGSFATLEDCYEVDLVPDDATLEREHNEQAEWLAEDGADYLFPETINSVREAKAMARAASQTGLPFMITFVVDAACNLLDGTPIERAIEETDFDGRLGIGLNCRPLDVIDDAFEKLSGVFDGPTVIYANGIGRPHNDLGWVFEENTDSVAKYLASAQRWEALGAQIIGGCCGTTPAYIKALAGAFGK